MALEENDLQRKLRFLGLGATDFVRAEDVASILDEVDGSLVTATSSSTPRTLADRFGDVANLLDFCTSPTDPDEDFHPALAAALATGKPVIVPWRSAPYNLSSFPTLLSGARLIGVGKPTLKSTGSGRPFLINGRSDVEVSGLIFDGNNGSVTVLGAYVNNSNNVLISNVDFINQSSQFIVSGTSYGIQFDGVSFVDGASTALNFEGTDIYGCLIRDGVFTDNVGFGVRIHTGAHDIICDNLRTLSNGIELIGVTSAASDVTIINCHAEGCGDNGISVTGNDCRVIGCVACYNDHSGITFYGKRNLAVGNTVYNNGAEYAVSGLQWGGFSISQAFGGTGDENVVMGNNIWDDQAEKTQYHCIKINPNSDNNLVWGNRVNGAVGALVLDNGAGNIIATMTGASKLNLLGLPTSASGLATGDLWANSGVVTIA